MRLERLRARNYRSLVDADIAVGSVNVFIGANASGKSTILDALRFLGQAVVERDFRGAMSSRGGLAQVAWKGNLASSVDLTVRVADSDDTFEWATRLVRDAYGFSVEERVDRLCDASSPEHLLQARHGKGWWRSGERREKVPLRQSSTSCALAAAAADASFPAHAVGQFIGRWEFLDPSPFLMRHDGSSVDTRGLDRYGRNLAEMLYRLDRDTRKRILDAAQAIIRLPANIQPMLSKDEGRFYFVLQEPKLRYHVHQTGISSGTLRVLALMTALHTGVEPQLIGIEEPENHLHPDALSSLVEHVVDVRENLQLLVTTHSPHVLDVLRDPAAVRVTRRDAERGTVVESGDAEAARRALDASGFGLGEYHQTRGFGN